MFGPKLYARSLRPAAGEPHTYVDFSREVAALRPLGRSPEVAQLLHELRHAVRLVHE